MSDSVFFLTEKFSATYWLDRAYRARTFAENFQNPEARRLMLRAAENYEKIAAHVQMRSSKGRAGNAQGP